MSILKIRKIVLSSLALSIAFWIFGYAASPNKEAFLISRSWLYQIFWLPAHILCAYLSIQIYMTALIQCGRDYFQYSGKRIYLNFLFKKAIVSTAIVIPFIVLDGLEGYAMVIDEYAKMGSSGWLMLGIWALEWIATGFLWIHVLLTLKLTIDFYSQEYVAKNLDLILLANKNSHLLVAGVENSLVILIYALATFGYIYLVGGQASDYVALGVSAMFVLLAFLGGLFILRTRIEKALDAECERESLPCDASSPHSTEFNEPLVSGIDVSEELAATNSIIFFKPDGISKRSFSRLRHIKVRLLISNERRLNRHQLAKELFKFTEYEVRLSTIGISELRSVLVRLAAPASGIVAKLGIFSGH